jgi:putative intracellular protease/amidase
LDTKFFAETAVPYTAFKKAGFEVQFATENGKTPQCDQKMLKGITQKLLVRNHPYVSQSHICVCGG